MNNVLTKKVKALSILMVDFSCALKLAMPISVLSAIREAGFYNMTVKGGKYLEAMAEADTIVFDKTGTLTKAKPTVAKVISFNGDSPDELLGMHLLMIQTFFPGCRNNRFCHGMREMLLHAGCNPKKLIRAVPVKGNHFCYDRL